MLFTGEYEHTIDAKQRLAIPADIRSRLDPERDGRAFYALKGPNESLWLCPERTFEAMASAFESTLLPAEDILEFEVQLFSQARRLELDGSGRVLLPERLLQDFGLSDRVVILGVKDHLELRDPEAWATHRAETLGKQGEIVMRARRAIQERSDSSPKGA